MEIKAILAIKELEFKLTTEKLFINSLSSNETYALRSVNGISVKDKIELFNEELNNYKTAITVYNSSKRKAIISGAVGGIILVLSFIGIYFGFYLGTFEEFIGYLSIGAMIYFLRNKHPGDNEPILKSSVVITMNSGDKSFEFVKSEANSDEVAKFVFEVEQTLTAFHKLE